ncbi:hypothetical protein E3P99_03849 [Wallemia hederae]|uniref:UspA domain-containing protein n=1 Tax=Wallemia hederae TaxID=1540922 RepID=A0A4T0FDQ5_9BASI|nr:hypothetical protein E3P99_03849 [Wallemia hederae]
MTAESEGTKDGQIDSLARSTSQVALSSSSDGDNDSEPEIVQAKHPAERKRRLSSIRRLRFTRAHPKPRSSSSNSLTKPESIERSQSPELEALKDGTSASETESAAELRPKNNAFDDDADDDEVSDEELFDNAGTDEDDDELWNYDEQLYYNTEANSKFIVDKPLYMGNPEDNQLIDEGPNITRPVEDTYHTHSKRNNQDLTLNGPKFEKNRCTITIRQGDPDAALTTNSRRRKRYILASDLSHESKYAVEWAIGTVLRDGDELFIATVQETDTKLDGKSSRKSSGDKSKFQKERAAFSQFLAKQAVSILQRTKLHAIITCQAVHAKNSRHMLIDMIDFIEPTLAIVGSRGRSDLTGILLGSTSHYLVQKSSVPVMVARKRIKHGPRKRGNADLRNRRHVPLNRAAIDSVADKDESKMEKEDDADSEHAEGDEEDGDDEDEESKEQGN